MGHSASVSHSGRMVDPTKQFWDVLSAAGLGLVPEKKLLEKSAMAPALAL